MSMAGTPAAAKAPVDQEGDEGEGGGGAGGLSKGWYLRGADDANTTMWYGRLRAAGAVRCPRRPPATTPHAHS